MNVRNLSIAVAVLLVLSGVAWYLNRPAPVASTDPRIGTPLLASDVASKAARVRITDTDKQVELVRGSDGSWTEPTYYDFPVDFTKLSRLMNDLTAAKIQRLVTSRPEVLGRLEFKDTSIAISDADGKELWHVTLGKNAEGGGRYVKFGDEAKGYLADLSSYLDATPKSWADPSLLEVKADDVAKVEIGFPDATVPPVVVSRATKEDPWKATATPEGMHLKVDRIATLLGNFSAVRFNDTAAADDEKVAAAKAHSRTVRLTTFDGKGWTITLGRKPEEKRPKQADNTTSNHGTTGDAAEVGRVVPNAPSENGVQASPAVPAKEEAQAKAEPEFETIPAGPVFASIMSSDSSARVNAMMQKRAFQVSEWIFTGLPAAPGELFEAAPKPAAPAAPATVAKPEAAPAAPGP